jgi:cytidine diphosphoramidate kinase
MMGTTYWVTGLAGSGKSTVSLLLQEKLRKLGRPTILLDGDTLRDIFDNDLGFTESDRRKSARRNSRLSKLISEQGADVICATISMFDEIRDWNRQNIPSYLEVYLKVPMDVLQTRNQKNLYSENIETPVVGVSISHQEPKSPDLIINNDGSSSVDEICDQILKLKPKKRG